MPGHSHHALPHRLLARLRAAVLLAATAALAACAANAASSGPLPQFAQYEGEEVRDVKFDGELVVPRDTLGAVISTTPSRCAIFGLIPFCIGSFGQQKSRLDLAVLSRDVARIQLVHRDFGYYGTRVLPVVDEAADGDGVTVTFRIEPGDLVTLTALEVTGIDSLPGADRMLGRLALAQGEPFRRSDFLASVDTIRNWLLDRGYAYAQVLRNYEIDTIADVARVELNAARGPLVTVDSIEVTGTYRLDDETVRQQITVRKGGLLRGTELVRSQRALFDLELVAFAAVEVAPERMQATPDSLELDRDSIGTTVLVRIVEAPRYAADIAFGYGTRDCLRAQGSNLDRNFLGGARRLEVSGLVAKVGVADPVNGLERTLCPAFNPDDRLTAEDSMIADQLNYRLAANFVQPRLLATRTSLVAGLFTERISELDLYVRDATGGELGVVRQVARGTLASLTADIQRGRTRASDYFFCIAFELCRQEDIAELERSRWSNSIGLGLTQNRVRLDPFPSSGHQFRTTLDVASPVLGSDDRYLRLMADGVAYRELRDGVVLSVRLMGGTFLTGILDADNGYIPPERRFYGGGPTGVRGFRFNELGPTVYVARPRRTGDGGFVVDTVPSSTGGTRTLLASSEVTFPLPILSPNTLRGAVFLDAGQVWDTRDTLVARPGVRFTPGIGARIATPVGPFRLDVAYNGYDPEPGPLFGITERGELLDEPLLTRYQRARSGGFLNRLVLQVSVGNAL